MWTIGELIDDVGKHTTLEDVGVEMIGSGDPPYIRTNRSENDHVHNRARCGDFRCQQNNLCDLDGL